MHNEEMGGYEITNHVVDYQPSRRIAWEPVLTASRPDDQADIGDRSHHQWIYELSSGALANGQLAAARGYSEEAIAAAEEAESTWLLPQYWRLLGYVVYLEGKPQNAAVLYRKALTACRHHDPRLVGALIFHLALCAASMGDYRRAAQLTGAHDALDAALVAAAPAKAYEQDPSDQKLRDDNRARLRKALGAEESERAYTLGKSLRLEQACDLALGKTNPK
jgi:tetratricopeptide (TPR) repeat protein